MRVSNNTLIKVNDWNKKVQYSNLYPLLASLILLIISILQIISFVLSLGTSNPNYISTTLFTSEKSLYIATIISLIATTIAGPAGVYSSINLGKGNKKFYYFVVVQFSLFAINSMLLGLWYNMAVFIISIGLCTRMYINWSDQNREKPYKSIGNEKTLVSLLIYFILMIGLGFITYYTFWDFTLSDGINVVIPFLDSSVLIGTLIGFLLLSSHYKQAYLFYYISNITNLFMLILLGQWNVVITSVIIMINDYFGVVRWEVGYRKYNKLM